MPLDRIVSLAEDATPADLERAVAQLGLLPLRAGRRSTGNRSATCTSRTCSTSPRTELDRPVPAKFVRQLISVFADAELEDALAVMRRGGHHLARVLDAEGTDGGRSSSSRTSSRSSWARSRRHPPPTRAVPAHPGARARPDGPFRARAGVIGRP